MFYGLYHQAGISARDRIHASKAEYNRKEGLISQAKAEYAKATSPEPVSSSKCKILESDSSAELILLSLASDPKDDLEAFPWLQESK